MAFDTLGLPPTLCNTLHQQGLEQPTPIQQQVIPLALQGESLVATSHTGSGKTLAYLLPLVARLVAMPSSPTPRALVLAPTRELVAQITAQCEPLCQAVGLQCIAIYGGVPYASQIEALKGDVDVVIATPGRLLDLIAQGATACQQLPLWVVDEVDQMLSLGFREPLTQLATLRAPQAQSLGFSATLSPEVEALLEQLMPPTYQQIATAGEALTLEAIHQEGYYVSMEMMDHLLLHLLQREKPRRAILFTRSRKMADRLALLLRSHAIAAEAMHSQRSQAAREHILTRFKEGETSLLVATDVVARGIHVAEVEVVYNYGFPLEMEQYIHRIGRTARAGASGRAITLSPPEERELHTALCRWMRRNIPMHLDHPFYTPQVSRLLEGGMDAAQGKKKGAKGRKR